MSNSGYEQWMRKYRVLVVPQNGGEGIDVSGLRCTFYVEKAVNETPNFSQIMIYNLSQNSISGIKAGDKVILEAGYEANCGLIFTGDIVQPYTTKEGGTDLILTLICQDGDEYLNAAFVAETLAKNSTENDVINACATIGKNLISNEVGKKKYIRGKVLFGRASSFLSAIAKSHKSQFFVDDGKINIVAAKDYEKNEAVELNP